MKRFISPRASSVSVGFCLTVSVLVSFLSICIARSDQVHMQNGDNYFGKVMSLDGDTLVLQSDVLGTLRLPRAKIAGVSFVKVAPPPSSPSLIRTNQLARRQTLTSTNSSSEFAAAFRQLGADSNLVQQIQAAYLGDAGPEAKDKFNQLLGGLMSGKLDLNGLRAEAKSAADQVRSVRKDLGEDEASVVDGYLAILDSFLKETTPAGPANITNDPTPSAKPRPSSLPDE
jgi:hypothetical protein